MLDTQLLEGLVTLVGLLDAATGLGEFTVTSVNDGVHKSGSLHYNGKAVDLRSKTLPAAKVELAVREFKRNNPGFDLIWESRGLPNEHLHLEFDPQHANNGG